MYLQHHKNTIDSIDTYFLITTADYYQNTERIRYYTTFRMKYASDVLNRISDKYITEEIQQEEDDWNDFMELFGSEDDDCGVLDCDYEDILDDNDKKKRWKHVRINWNYHVNQLLHEGYFQNEYRMTYDSWKKLYNLLYPRLKPKRKVSPQDMPVTVQLIVAVGIKWLTGSDLNSCRHIFKMSRTEVYRCANKFLFAVLETKRLQIKLPKNQNQWDEVKLGFEKKSTRGCMSGCCGALDGIFIRTYRPRYTEVANVRSYYSGHYEHYGLNCQGMCDAYLRFLYFGIVAPGSTNDNVAYTRTGELKISIESLRLGDYVVGDAAYSVTEKLLVPFTGSQRDDPKQDAFNFYLSQLRIRIEMAFGLLVKKFRILKKPMKQKLVTVSRIIMCCAQLHNFIINNDGENIVDDSNMSQIDVNNLNTVMNGEREP